MPTKVNVELIIVWACVGFFTGAGWALATWLVGRILGLTHLYIPQADIQARLFDHLVGAGEQRAS